MVDMPRNAKRYVVDASVCGAKGLFWRQQLGGGAKFVTRTGDGDAGFARNGHSFVGSEEQRGMVKCLATGLWLPLRDEPAAAAAAVAPQAFKSFAPVLPVGRSGLGRDRDGNPVPYLHEEDCGCGGRWCKPHELPLAPVEEPFVARAATAKAAAPAVATAPPPQRKWRWTDVKVWWLVLAAAVLFALSRYEPRPETAEERMQRLFYAAASRETGSTAPSLQSILAPLFYRG